MKIDNPRCLDVFSKLNNADLEPVIRTITCNHKEFVVIRDGMSDHIGKCRYDLLLGGKFGALLKLEIAYGTRQRKIAVDPSKIDETPRCTYTGLFS